MRLLRALVLAMFAATFAFAHVGSPDAYLDAKAGPYQLFITVQPPPVIPGVAQVQVRAESPGVRSVHAAPLALTGLYADVVHEDGFPETLVSEIMLPAVHGVSLAGDDAAATAPSVSELRGTTTTFTLPDGYRMKWLNGDGPQKANHPELFKFELVDAQGHAPPDMALYMGMLGHAAFVKTDGSVFAHIHPNGSVAMAAFMTTGNTMPMAGMHHDQPMTGLPNQVSFPYGFPQSGRYRIIVQMKHGSTIETGVFDAQVE